MPEQGGLVFFSIVIPVKDEETKIGRCLEAIAALDYPPERLEVKVVDNGSTDNTKVIVQQFGFAALFDAPGVTIGAVRNAGAAAAKGDVLAFLDADCIVKPDWLSRAEKHFNNGLLLFGGNYSAQPEYCTLVERAWTKCARGKLGPVRELPGGNIFISRRLFEELGSYDEALRTSEDTELCLRAADRRVRTVYDPALAVVHLGGARSVKDVFRQSRWHASSMLEMRRRGRALKSYLSALMFLGSAAAFLAGLLLLLISQQPWLLYAAGCGFLSLMLAGVKSRGLRGLGALEILMLSFLYLPATAGKGSALVMQWLRHQRFSRWR